MSSKKPIVYLRPFGIDERKISNTSFLSKRKLSFRTYEQQLKHAVGKLGPFVAVGKPGENVSPLGAARMYLDHSKWQKTVVKLVEKAQLVLVHLGKSEGLIWELHHVVKTLKPENVILCLPLNKRGDEPDRILYEIYRKEYFSIFPRPLPKKIGDAQFMYFSRNWTPHLLEPRRSKLVLNIFELNECEDIKILILALERLNKQFSLATTPLLFRHPSIYTFAALITFILSLRYCE